MSPSKTQGEDDNYCPRLLRLAATHDPILHMPTQPIKFPLSYEDKNIIHDMVYSIQKEQLKAANAPWESAAGMAANQWGISKSIFLFCRDSQSETQIEVVINPSYEPILSKELTKSEVGVDHHKVLEVNENIEEEMAWEACFSLPMAAGFIKRYRTIIARYQNMIGECIIRKIDGWEARVFQHETDHLMGHLYDDLKIKKCMNKKVFSTKEELTQFRKGSK